MSQRATNPSLELYREKVVLLIKSNSESIINNQSKDHAIIILQELIRSAQETVHIVCTRLSKSVYGNLELLETIKNAFLRNVSFHVAVKDSRIESYQFANMLTDNGVSIMRAPADSINDFCVVDSKRFRFEMNQSTREARVCANEPQLSKKMVSIFNTLCVDPANPWPVERSSDSQ